MQDELKNLPRIDSLLDPSPETVEGENAELVPLDTPVTPPIQEGV